MIKLKEYIQYIFLQMSVDKLNRCVEIMHDKSNMICLYGQNIRDTFAFKRLELSLAWNDFLYSVYNNIANL